MAPRSTRLVPAMLACLIIGSQLSRPVHAENIIFPHVKTMTPGISGIIDITEAPYSADKTGRTDVTSVLQQAFTDHKAWTTVYFPNGTYLVSNTLRISEICVTGGGSANCGVSAPIVQGQSTTGTVIKLAAGSFTNAAFPSPVLFSGDGVAQIFKRGIHNLTVLVGPNNAGANGVRWFSNNTGLMSDVRCISEDASANVGVDIAGGEQGPCGMRDIYVKGFAIGCRSNALNSVTVLNLTVEDARSYGVLNETNPLYIDNLTCARALVGVRNTGFLALINARLTGGTSSKSAIENTSMLFARSVAAEGYQKALTTTGRTAPAGSTIDEYSTAQISQFPSPTHSMGLPFQSIPDVAWEQDTTKWGNVWVNKGGFGTQKTDSASFQQLIDNANLTTVCVPAGRVLGINGDILIRGNISRIVGTGGSFNGTGRLVITNNLTQPVIKLERMDGLQIVNQSNKTVVIESYNGSITSTGSGDMFLCDVVGDYRFNNPNQRIWAWQLNAEGSCGPNGELCLNGAVNVNVHVDNVKAFRIFGWKDEGNGCSIDVVNGAVEILGFMNYPSLPTTGQTEFIVRENGQFSLACATQVSFNNSWYANLVQETRAGVTKTLTATANGNTGNIALYTGYDSTAVAALLTAVRSRAGRQTEASPTSVGIEGQRIVITGSPGNAGRAREIGIFSVNGARQPVSHTSGTTYVTDRLTSGTYVVRLPGGFSKALVVAR